MYFPERNQLPELVAICIRKFQDNNFREEWVHRESFYGILLFLIDEAVNTYQKELWEDQDLENVELILSMTLFTDSTRIISKSPSSGLTS